MLLLDTHVFLWYISGDERLTDAIRERIADVDTAVYLSVVSVWEATIKYQREKIAFPEPPGTFLPVQRQRHGIQSLPLSDQSVARLGELPALHRDPFDRMLICQAMESGLTLVTVDAAIRAYGVPVL